MTDQLPNIPQVKERIGVLLVHGIGEQQRYKHLEDEANALVKALRAAAPPGALFKLNVVSDAGDTPGAMRCRWPDGEHPPAVVEIEEPDGVTEISFREVWWADLGHEANRRSFFSFLCWATSMWTHPNPKRSPLPGASRVRLPGPQGTSGPKEIHWGHRVYLFLLGVFIWLLLPLWGLLRISPLRRINPPAIVAKYLGDVKLYQDDHRPGTTRLEDGGLKPRVAIRRRMICALTQMALDGYDRWYLLGHSLGSVVTFNGLMETEQCLPALLNPSLLERAKTAGIAITAPTPDRQVRADEYRSMLPPRRAALGRDLILCRNALFNKLKGVVTYGSPLERFRALWPHIVAINLESEKDSRALMGVRWFNLHDPSDAVAPPLTSFDPKGNESLKAPTNLAYCSGLLPLMSHVRYLSAKGRKPSAGDAIAQWLLDDARPLDQAKNTWLSRSSVVYPLRLTSQFAMWLVLLALTVCATTALLKQVWPWVKAYAGPVAALATPILPSEKWQALFDWTFLPGLAVMWVLIAGVVRSVQRRHAASSSEAQPLSMSPSLGSLND